MHIRPYLPSDYDRVRGLLIEGKIFDEVWDSQANLTEKISLAPESILVAELDDLVVGSIYIMSDGWCAFIYRLIVQDDQRRQGVGTKLMEAAEAQLRSKGVPEVCLYVTEENPALQDWYAKRGYGGTNRYRSMWKKL